MTDSHGWRREGEHAWLEPPGSPAGAVVLLHDADGQTPLDDPAWAAALATHDLAAVAPLTGASWWTDRLAPDEPGPAAESVALAAVAAACERWGDAPIALAGVGAGGHGALRLAYKRARELPVVAAWRPAIDCHQLIDRRMPAPEGIDPAAVHALSSRYRDAEQARQDSAVLHIHPLGWPRHQWIGSPPGDPWWEGCDRLRMKLAAIGVPHEVDLDTAAHANDPAVADRVVRWIAERLDAERRRA